MNDESDLYDFDVFVFRSKFLLPFDHHFPGKSDDGNKPVATVVLYGDFGNQNEFRSFHNKLSSLALNGKIDYVLRHNSQVSLLAVANEFNARTISAVKRKSTKSSFSWLWSRTAN